jgi:hypothetical protein
MRSHIGAGYVGKSMLFWGRIRHVNGFCFPSLSNAIYVFIIGVGHLFLYYQAGCCERVFKIPVLGKMLEYNHGLKLRPLNVFMSSIFMFQGKKYVEYLFLK